MIVLNDNQLGADVTAGELPLAAEEAPQKGCCAVQHDNTLKGTGRVGSPLGINAYTSAGLAGSGQPDDPIRLTQQTTTPTLDFILGLNEGDRVYHQSTLGGVPLGRSQFSDLSDLRLELQETLMITTAEVRLGRFAQGAGRVAVALYRVDPGEPVEVPGEPLETTIGLLRSYENGNIQVEMYADLGIYVVGGSDPDLAAADLVRTIHDRTGNDARVVRLTVGGYNAYGPIWQVTGTVAEPVQVTPEVLVLLEVTEELPVADFAVETDWVRFPLAMPVSLEAGDTYLLRPVLSDDAQVYQHGSLYMETAISGRVVHDGVSGRLERRTVESVFIAGGEWRLAMPATLFVSTVPPLLGTGTLADPIRVSRAQQGAMGIPLMMPLGPYEGQEFNSVRLEPENALWKHWGGIPLSELATSARMLFAVELTLVGSSNDELTSNYGQPSFVGQFLAAVAYDEIALGMADSLQARCTVLAGSFLGCDVRLMVETKDGEQVLSATVLNAGSSNWAGTLRLTGVAMSAQVGGGPQDT